MALIWYAGCMVFDRLRVGGRVVADKTTRLLAREWCFYAILVLLVVQALWLALTARYPMAFDEDFHFGLIKLHAQQWAPFFTSQPPHADVLGPVVRDPSYLYHYLMSFPYRMLGIVTSNQVVQIIVLRCINIGLFVWGLVLMRRLLFRLGASRALNHFIMLIFCLVPITPFLAAHINYDNLFIPLLTWSILATCNWVDRVNKHQLPLASSATLVSGMLLASLVKYAYLPVLATIVVIMAEALWLQRHHWSKLWRSMLDELERLSILRTTFLILLVTLSGCLFLERYAVNLVQYHAPNPSCNQVLPVASCVKFGPWGRDYVLMQMKPALSVGNVITYPGQWVAGMWQRCFFAINDQYVTRPSMPVPADVTAGLAAVCVCLFVAYGWKSLRPNPCRMIAIATLLAYMIVLFVANFQGYLKTGLAVAVNGRYLLPFLPIVFFFAAFGFKRLWVNRPALKGLAALLLLLVFLQGGGALTFIIRSDESWDWQSPIVVHANNAARDILQLFVIGAKRHYY